MFITAFAAIRQLTRMEIFVLDGLDAFWKRHQTYFALKFLSFVTVESHVLRHSLDFGSFEGAMMAVVFTVQRMFNRVYGVQNAGRNFFVA